MNGNANLNANNLTAQNVIDWKKKLQLQSLSNSNLLINGNFRVNQRGKSSYKSNSNGTLTYMIDKWGATWETELTSINDNSITLKFVRQYGRFAQKIEEYKNFRGKTVTLTLSYTNLTNTNAIYLRLNDGVNSFSTKIQSESGIISLTRTIDNNATELSVDILNTATTETIVTLNIEQIKLEIGEVFTGFVLNIYAQELSICQRYYQLRTTDYNFASSELDRTPVMRSVGTIGTTTINGKQYKYCDADMY